MHISKIDNYFMKPQNVENLGLIYPIKIFEYEEFKILAVNYILLDINSLNNLRRQNKEPVLKYDNLFDILIDAIEEQGEIRIFKDQINILESATNEVLNEILLEKEEYVFLLKNKDEILKTYELTNEFKICKLISMLVNKKVIYNVKNKIFEVLDEQEKVVGVLDRNNFYEFREKVMEMNLLFEPLVSPDKNAQKYIDAKLKGNGNQDSSILSIIAFVSTNVSHDISGYSYYRLMADYYSLIKQLGRRESTVYRASGSKQKNGKDIEIPDITEELGFDENPYSKLFTVSKNEEDK